MNPAVANISAIAIRPIGLGVLRLLRDLAVPGLKSKVPQAAHLAYPVG